LEKDSIRNVSSAIDAVSVFSLLLNSSRMIMVCLFVLNVIHKICLVVLDVVNLSLPDTSLQRVKVSIPIVVFVLVVINLSVLKVSLKMVASFGILTVPIKKEKKKKN